ncbi:Bacterial transcriptional regulator [Budvicia aquatica]|nr:Bacterial transcriptional regulator [Budvicia aquatica]
MAWLTDDEVDALLPDDQQLQRFTDTTITDKFKLKQALAEIRV